MIDAGLKLYTAKVVVREKHGGELLEVLIWDNMPFEVLCKWKWYFKYRAALLQVKYPKSEVELRTFDEPAKGQYLIYQLKNRHKGRRAKITELSRKLELAEKNWSYLFPITDDPQYKAAVAKIERLKQELAEFENEFKHQLNIS